MFDVDVFEAQRFEFVLEQFDDFVVEVGIMEAKEAGLGGVGG